MYAIRSYYEINCRQAHLYGSDNALRFGGKYTYFCPLSLTHFTVPILIDGIVRGALVGGPVLLINHDEYFSEEILKHASLSRITSYNVCYTKLLRLLLCIFHQKSCTTRHLLKIMEY